MAALTSKKTRVDEIKEKITCLIDGGDWLPGERIPAEIELAQRLAASRKTVRKALLELAADGVILDHGRAGRFVTHPQTTSSAESAGESGGELYLLSTGREIPLTVPAGSLAAFDLGVISRAMARGLSISCLHPERFEPQQWCARHARNGAGLVIGASARLNSAAYAPLFAGAGANTAICVCGEEEGMRVFDRICFDHRQGCYLLTRHLLRAGCRRILPLGGGDFAWLRERDEGYLAALGESGIAALRRVSYAEKTRRDDKPGRDRQNERGNLQARAQEMAEALRRAGAGRGSFDALMLTTDSMVFPAIFACRTLGLEPGRDVLIAGYDAYWQTCWELEHTGCGPAVTVDKNNFRAGGTALDLLLLRLEGKLPPEPQRVVIAPELLISEDAALLRARKTKPE